MIPRSTTVSGYQRVRTLMATAVVLVAVCLWGGMSCSSGSGADPGSGFSGGSSGDLDGGIGVAVNVGDAVITVTTFEAAFQPVAPPQRLSDETLIAPAAGEGFYQAQVQIANRGEFPLRIDPEDFVCRIGNTIHRLEPTRSGPMARSIIYGTSLNLVLTFRGEAGLEPTLIYSPPWHDGMIRFAKATATQGQGQPTTTVGEAVLEPTTTEVTTP